MTDQDNLRDRMQGVLSEHRQIASGPGDCVCACNRTWVPDAEHRAHVAQAIIDEFELTIEPHCEECEHKVIEGWWGKQ